jgi:hypothetical protein
LQCFFFIKLVVRSIAEITRRCMNRGMKHVQYNDWTDYDSCPNHDGSTSIGYVIVNETTTMTNITTQEVSINPAALSPSAKKLNGNKTCNMYKENKRNSNVKFYQEEIEMLNTNSEDDSGSRGTVVQLGNRESPIDCYPVFQSANNRIMSKYSSASSTIFNKHGQRQNVNDSELKILNNALIERIKSDISMRQSEMQAAAAAAVLSGQLRRSSFEMLDENYLIESQNFNINNLGQLSHQVKKSAGNRKSLIRNSSLSTISEEKTVISLDDTPRSSYELEPTADNWLAIKRVINDFDNVLSDENRAVLLDEFRKVFEASSKDGNFCRNVPIRISSPFKNRRSANTSIEYSPQSAGRSVSPMRICENASPAENSIDCEASASMNVEDKSLFKAAAPTTSYGSGFNANLNKLVAKKMRFVKRLKNRIEQKRGRPLVLLTRNNSLTNFASENQAMSRSNSAYKWLTYESNSNSKNELLYEISDTNNNNCSIVLPKSNVQPVFF